MAFYVVGKSALEEAVNYLKAKPLPFAESYPLLKAVETGLRGPFNTINELLKDEAARSTQKTVSPASSLQDSTQEVKNDSKE